MFSGDLQLHGQPVGGFLALLDAGAAFAPAIAMPRIGAPPPQEIRIFKWGANSSTKGTAYLTEGGAKKIMAAFATRGVAQVFDLWHSFFDKTLKPEDKKSAGQYLLEVRGSPASGEGGLYLVRCQFAPDIAAEISAGKWPYLSPAFLHTKDGEIVDVLNCALVGRPATHGAQPLLLSLLSGVLNMSKGRLLRDCYAAFELAHQRCQALASDGDDAQQKELGNSMSGQLTPVMQLAAEHMRSAGMMELAQKEIADAAAKRAAGDRCLALLSAEFGETDPDKLAGRAIALKTARDITDIASSADKSKATELAAKLLCDQNTHRAGVATKREGWLKQIKEGGMTLETLQALLSDLPQVTPPPSAAMPQTPPPPAPTSDAAKQLADKAAEKAAAAKAAGEAPTLATLSAGEKIGLEFFEAKERERLGDKFDSAAARSAFLTTLSDTREQDFLLPS